jgi:hypothetical protein
MTPPPCWTCGYNLTGTPSSACPECGRPFSLADPASVNYAKPMRRLGRRALAPLSLRLPALALLAAALLLATVRYPVDGARLAFVDLDFYWRFWNWRGRQPAMSPTDALATVGLALAQIAAILWLCRLFARAFAVLRYRPPAFQRGRFWPRSLALLALLALATCAIAIGWPYRVGQRETREWEHDPGWSRSRGYAYAPADAIPAQAAALRYGPPRQRVAALKMLAERWNWAEHSLPILRAAVRRETDPAVLAAEIHVLALARDGDSGSFFKAALDDPAADPAVRAAAADALGLLHLPAHLQVSPGDFMTSDLALRTNPPVRVTSVLSARDHRVYSTVVHPTPPGTRESLERLMLQGGTLEERDAAARALVHRPPPNHHLRYAEWGVFQTRAGTGDIQFAKEQLDEIPPFVHRVGNPTAELEQRITPMPLNVWKPVIHLTAAAPMAVDLEVCIAGGRPWVAHPRIDDLVIAPIQADFAARNRLWRADSFTTPGTTQPSTSGLFQPFDPPPGLPVQPDLREGYPWLAPAHRTLTVQTWGPSTYNNQIVSGPNSVLIGGIGARWQSLIVSPTKLPWMQPAPVGQDPRFKWWQRLRDVESSWVSNRGESERFLYYDGPSLRSAPVSVSFRDGQVDVFTNPAAPAVNRRGCYLQVAPAGVALVMIDNIRTRPIDISAARPQPPAAAEAALAEALIKQGLTPSETAGLLQAWRPAFFQTPGRRFLSFLTREDYDQLCPLNIHPAPETTVRVGLLWTEFPNP